MRRGWRQWPVSEIPATPVIQVFRRTASAMFTSRKGFRVRNAMAICRQLQIRFGDRGLMSQLAVAATVHESLVSSLKSRGSCSKIPVATVVFTVRPVMVLNMQQDQPSPQLITCRPSSTKGTLEQLISVRFAIASSRTNRSSTGLMTDRSGSISCRHY